MWIKEPDARKMLCPLLAPNPLPGYHCATVKCMAWRWRNLASNDKLGTCAYLQRVGDYKERGWSR